MEKEKEGVSRYWVWGVFFAALGAHLFLAVKWQNQFFASYVNNTAIFMEDLSRDYQRIVSLERGFNLFSEFHRFFSGNYWPPVVPVAGLWTLVTFPAQCFFLPNFFFLAMIMLGTYFSTRLLIGSRFYSMLAAVIFSCYWFVMIQLVAFELQLAVTACVAWSFYWYLRSCSFARFWPSLLTGLFMVLSLYCDRLMPGVFVFALFLVPENFRSRKSLLLMAMVMALVVTGAWPFYGKWFNTNFGNPRNIEILFSSYGDFTPPMETFKTILRDPSFLLAHLFYYFVSLTEKLLGYYFTALLAMGMLFLHRLKKPCAQTFWTVLAVPLMAFVLIPKKDYIYIFPLCFYFSVISGIGIHSLRNKWIRYSLVLLIAVVVVQQYLWLFQLPGGKKDLFFSRQFGKTSSQKPPKLYLLNYPNPGKEAVRGAYAIVNAISPLIGKRASSGEQKQALILDLQGYVLQNTAAFLFRVGLPKTKVINSFYAFPLGQDKTCEEDYLYLLSDEKRYAVERGSGEGGGCSWKGLEPLYRLPNSETVLFKVRR